MITFIGKPQSGKSSIINSIIKNPKIVYSSVPTLIGSANTLKFGYTNSTKYYESDTKFSFLDNPQKYITFASIIFWTTEYDFAFTEESEINDYNALKTKIKSYCAKSHKLIQIGILLSKSSLPPPQYLLDLFPNEIIISYDSKKKQILDLSIFENTYTIHNDILQKDIFNNYYTSIITFFNKYNGIFDIHSNLDELKKIKLPNSFNITPYTKNNYYDIIMHFPDNSVYDEKIICFANLYIISRLNPNLGNTNRYMEMDENTFFIGKYILTL